MHAKRCSARARRAELQRARRSRRPPQRSPAESLGRGVEAEAERDADRVDLPARVDPAADSAQEERGSSRRGRAGAPRVGASSGRSAGRNVREARTTSAEHEQVEQTVHEQELARRRSCRPTPPALEPGRRAVDRARGDRERGHECSTTVEWPSEKKKPTPTGALRRPAISLRVVLSIAAMWSASNA